MDPVNSPNQESPVPFMRYGILCSSTHFQKWQADAIRELIAKGHQLELLIVDIREQKKRGKEFFLWRFFSQGLLFRLLQNKIFLPHAKKMVDLSSFLEGTDTLTCTVIKKKSGEYFQDSEIEAIKTYKLDFILRFGFNILRGEILNSARYGIWSFHHDDELKYRGGPPGFWEIYRGDPLNGAILQRLTERLDAGIILFKGYLKTISHSYKGNQEQLLSISSSWPARVADQILRQPDSPFFLSETKAPVFKIPGNLYMVVFLLKLLINRFRFYYRDLLSAEIWNVGLIRKPIQEVVFGKGPIENSQVIWLRQFASTKYLADPFGFYENRKLHILVEDYSYERNNARISEIIYDISRNSFSVPITLIEGEQHLSYPFIVEHEGFIYCVPESHRSKNISLYLRNYSEEAFVKESVLVPNVEAIDPTLVFYEERWWLFFTERKYSTSSLHIYFSDSIKGEYLPHPRNPVKIDVRSSRSGGTPFIHEGILYRPAQNCSITYGGSITINKVVRLTPEEFEEVPVKTIGPVKNSPFPGGLHTLSQIGNYTLIDGKRYQVNYYFFYHQLREKFRKRIPEDV